MIKVKLIRKVQGNNAKLYVHRDVKLSTRPHIGESIISDIYGRCVTVADVQQVANTDKMYVFLEPDYRLYKAPEKLDEIINGYKARDWEKATSTDMKDVAP